MDAIGSQSASSWWLSLFSQLQTVSEGTLTSDSHLSFEQLLAQLQQQGLGFSQSDESLAPFETQINPSLVDIDSTVFPEDLQSVMGVTSLADIQIAEPNTKGALNFAELSSQLRGLKQALMGVPIQDIPLSPSKTELFQRQQTFFSEMPANSSPQVSLQASNNQLNTMAVVENQTEFFYRFATASGLAEEFKPIKGFQQNASIEGKKLKLEQLNPLSLSSLTQFDALGEGEIERQVNALKANSDTSLKLDGQGQTMPLQQSVGEENKAIGSDFSSELRKESGLQELLKLKLQDPQLRTQLSSKVADRIQIMQQQGIQHARIQLDPPELGQLDIRLQFHQDQLQVNVMSQIPQVRDALEGHSIRLREMLEQQGVELTDMQFFDESDKEHPAFAGGHWGEDGQQNEHQSEDLTQAQAGNLRGVASEALSAVKTLTSVLSVDLFV